MLTIHHAPYTRGLRVIWQCEEMGVPYTLAPVPFPPPPDYRAVNPIGSVPFLEDGAVRMNESLAMMLYIAQKYGPTPLLPAPDSQAHARALQFLIFGETTITMWINVMNVSLFFAPDADKQNWTSGEAARRVAAAIDYLAPNSAIVNSSPATSSRLPIFRCRFRFSVGCACMGAPCPTI